MRRAALVAAALSAIACGSSSPKPVASAPAPAVAPSVAPRIAAQEQYYDIYGSSVAELREQISRLGPAGGDDALTVWDLESQYTASRTTGGCVLRNVQVTLTVTTTLPRWTPPKEAAPARLVESWRAYLQHVKLHEAGHRLIAERNARDLAGALSGLRGDTCQQLEGDASRTVERIVAEGRAKNRAYDVETKHGQTQGVVLGP